MLAADRIDTPVQLKDQRTIDQYRDIVQKLAISQSDQHDLVRGLEVAYDQLSSVGNGARKDVPKILVFITASDIRETGRETELVNRLRRLGKVFISKFERHISLFWRFYG